MSMVAGWFILGCVGFKSCCYLVVVGAWWLGVCWFGVAGVVTFQVFVGWVWFDDCLL